MGCPLWGAMPVYRGGGASLQASKSSAQASEHASASRAVSGGLATTHLADGDPALQCIGGFQTRPWHDRCAAGGFETHPYVKSAVAEHGAIDRCQQVAEVALDWDAVLATRDQLGEVGPASRDRGLVQLRVGVPAGSCVAVEHQRGARGTVVRAGGAVPGEAAALPG